ncbi:MAG: 4-(cytidine 5'-diphospho)-2-C-methyl-D-erythritol kinase [Chitinophagaceae bacterium]|nr:4-(cytidine 5'-diphospho)-2-C-methyl-D-erythritol kinase [Chitinophagaceae bacterium]
MVVFPNCKINLGLNITRKRSDGFHDLETIFYPLPFYDILEVIETAEQNDIAFSTSGIPVEGNAENNLCIKAWRLLKKDIPSMPPVQMHLHKAIPIGAGLGGGSADGAFALKLLNEKFNPGLTTQQLIHYALQLGSDCPFFIINKPCFATGRGELLEAAGIDLSNYKIVIVNPGIHVNTGHAFSMITPAQPDRSVKEIIAQPISTWKTELKNDFEKAVFSQHPEIGQIKDELYESGAVYAAMSGSGSTVYGIFEKEMQLQLSFPSHYFVKVLNK